MFSSSNSKDNKMISKNHKCLEIAPFCGFNFKRGFTLIELLAALVILSIMALIVYPTIGRMIINHKTKAYEQQIDIVKKAAANWLTTNEDKLKDNSYALSINTLLSSGLIEEDELINPIDNELIDGCVLITWRKGIKQYDYNYVTSCDDFVIPKLLSLKASSKENEYGWRNKDFYISLNGSDLENYYYCIDNNKCEPNIMVADINETIAFNEEGIKYVCAYGMNKSGETESICEKYKLDKTNPIIGTITFEGTTGLDNWYISDVVVDITESIDNLSGIDSNVLSPSETLITKDTKGTTYTLTAKDKAGNISSVSYDVKVDKTKPIVGELVVNGTKGKNDWWISDLTFGVKEGTDDISGHLTTTSSITSLTKETKGITVTVTTMNKAGSVSKKDYIVKMDKTVPTAGTLVINGTKGSNDWYTSDLTFKVNNGSDNISGHSKTTSTHSELKTETKGITVVVTTENMAGLTSTREYPIKMDKSAPIVGELVVASGTLGENNWYTSDITFKVNNGSDDISDHVSTISSIYSITSDTDNTKVTVTTKNGAGLISTKDYYFKLDKTAPTCTLAVNTNGISFSNKSSDVTNSGISTSTSVSYGSQTASLSNNTFYGYLKDRAGNFGKCSVNVTSTSIAYDKITTTCNESSVNNPISYYTKTTYYCNRTQTDTNYSCSSGTYPNDGGNSCYTYTSGSSYNGCSSGSYSGGTCYKYDQISCSSGWSSTKTTSAKYTCSKSATLCSATTERACKNSGCYWLAGGFNGNGCYANSSYTTKYKCSSGTLSGKKCYLYNQISCSSGWSSTKTTSEKYKCSKTADACATGWTACTWCTSSKCKKVSATVTKTPVYSYSFDSGNSSYNLTSCSSNNFTCNSSNYGSTKTSCTLSKTEDNYTYTYSTSSSTQKSLSSCQASTGYSSCSGSYSSSQSSMKGKVNISCKTNGYTCSSGYTKLNDSYCYKLG